MPAPLAMPVTSADRSPTATRRLAILTPLSVVRMPSAASMSAVGLLSKLRRSSLDAGSDLIHCQILADDAGGHDQHGRFVDVPSQASAVSRVMARASSIPRWPVHAFAFPELITTARIVSAGVRARSSTTGAAQTKFCV